MQPCSQQPHPDTDMVREGVNVDLRRHRRADRDAFLRWYQDPDIALLLRHDLQPLDERQAQSYFDSIIMPASARGTCWAITEHETGAIVGSTAVVDVNERSRSSLFRLVIGEKDQWGKGYGTEATDLALAEAFDSLDLVRVNLEVFGHNPRAQRAYQRVGFVQTGQHQEWVARALRQIDVIEMSITRDAWKRRGPIVRDSEGETRRA